MFRLIGSSGQNQFKFLYLVKQARRPSSSGGGSGGGYAPGMLGASQYAPGSVSGPAPTTKPPTPPQAVRYGSGGGSGGGTLNRGSKEYRTPPVVNPPQVPSNYAPNYPRQQQQERQQQKQYGTLPQVQMVHPVQQGPDPMDHLRSAGTMPRLSSSSMRSTASSQGSGSMGGGGGGDPMAGMYGKLSNTLGRPPQQQQLLRQNTPPGSLGGSSSRHSNTPPTQQQVHSFSKYSDFCPLKKLNVKEIISLGVECFINLLFFSHST